MLNNLGQVGEVKRSIKKGGAMTSAGKKGDRETANGQGLETKVEEMIQGDSRQVKTEGSRAESVDSK